MWGDADWGQEARREAEWVQDEPELSREAEGIQDAEGVQTSPHRGQLPDPSSTTQQKLATMTEEKIVGLRSYQAAKKRIRDARLEHVSLYGGDNLPVSLRPRNPDGSYCLCDAGGAAIPMTHWFPGMSCIIGEPPPPSSSLQSGSSSSVAVAPQVLLPRQGKRPRVVPPPQR